MIELIYSLFFALTLVAAVLVVFSRHAVYSALYLVAMMISIAGIFILINAQLAAVLQILVYAGAIMVLFLFVIMLLNLGRMPEAPYRTRRIRQLGAALFAILITQVLMLAVRIGGELHLPEEMPPAQPLGDVALLLLTRYLYAFEMTSIMLLIAVIGAMVLARRPMGLHAGERRSEP